MNFRLRHLYLSNRFFFAGGVIVAVFALGFGWTFFLALGKALLSLLFILLAADIITLFSSREPLHASRQMASMFSLGESHEVKLYILNRGNTFLRLRVIDELPEQLQIRGQGFRLNLAQGQEKRLSYTVRPLSRGAYQFGSLQLFARTRLGLAERRHRLDLAETIKVFPSILQMKNLELNLGRNITQYHGIKRLRRLGHSYEFEQIRNFQDGDEYRSINWKATSRRNAIMVNQYDDERSQQVYAVIDRSRSMLMPFGGLTLLDHSINTALVISNIALQRHDKAGVMSFADTAGSYLRAERSGQQLRRILELLYREKEGENEANYEGLLAQVQRVIKGRSLLLLYTNFESYYAMQRVLPVLRRLNHMHLLVVMFFENTGISDFSMQEASNLHATYEQAVARNFVIEKYKIQQELRRYGIASIQNRPEDLAINTINKYLELKSRGLI